MTGLRIHSIVACACLWTAAAIAGQPPKELVQYIQEARKAGVAERQIEENAVKAGWGTAAVRDAIEYLRGSKTAAPAQAAPDADKPKPAGTAADQSPSGAPVKPAAVVAAAETSPGATAAPEVKPKAAVDRGVPDEYVIGEGDVLHVSVWKEPDASVQSAVVRPDGKISMPMLKDVLVAGLTPSQAEANLTKQLSAFISAADVTVVVSAINSKKIYVVGGVKKEGPIAYTYRMTVLQALSEAGGLTDYAKKKKIYVLRHENGRDYQLPFNYDAVLKGERMELNVPLLPGDTIVVPK